MAILRVVAITVLVVGVMGLCRASADPSAAEKFCIFASAARLPAVPGLRIVASHAAPVTKKLDANTVGHVATTIVHNRVGKDAMTFLIRFDIRAAGQSATYEFACGFNSIGTAVEPIGVVKWFFAVWSG